MKNTGNQTIYKLTVQGHLKQKWADWLGAMVIQNDPDEAHTAIIVRVPDQAALRGIMNRLWDLNLTILNMGIKDDGSIGAKNEN